LSFYCFQGPSYPWLVKKNLVLNLALMLCWIPSSLVIFYFPRNKVVWDLFGYPTRFVIFLGETTFWLSNSWS
jgi:hypothetical protein